MIGAFTAGFWRRLAVALGHEEWITDPRFESNADRVRNRSVLVPIIEELMAGRDRDKWCEILAEHDVPFTPIYSVPEALASELAGNSTHTLTDGSGRTAHVSASPIRASQWPDMKHGLPPHMGDDTVAVLNGLLGRSPEEIDDLCDRGVAGKKE